MKIGVILGSTREGRLGKRVATWVMNELRGKEGIEPVLLDLGEFPLPFYSYELLPIQMGEVYPDKVAQKWKEAVELCDGFIFVTPEYNHSFPAVLKNALDFLYKPWNDKPAAIISYSNGMIGGARSVEQLRTVLSHLRLITVSEAMSMGKADTLISEEGALLTGPFSESLERIMKDVVRLGQLRR